MRKRQAKSIRCHYNITRIEYKIEISREQKIMWRRWRVQMLKHSTTKLREAILKLFNLILFSGHFPEQWKVGHSTPIHKKGDKLKPDNYRGITQGRNLGTLFCAILNNIITQFIQNNNIINSSQIRFSQNNTPTVHIYTSHTLIEEHVQNVKKVKYLVVS